MHTINFIISGSKISFTYKLVRYLRYDKNIIETYNLNDI